MKLVIDMESIFCILFSRLINSLRDSCVTVKVTDLNMSTSSSEDMNASAHDVIGSGHGANMRKPSCNGKEL